MKEQEKFYPPYMTDPSLSGNDEPQQNNGYQGYAQPGQNIYEPGANAQSGSYQQPNGQYNGQYFNNGYGNGYYNPYNPYSGGQPQYQQPPYQQPNMNYGYQQPYYRGYGAPNQTNGFNNYINNFTEKSKIKAKKKGLINAGLILGATIISYIIVQVIGIGILTLIPGLSNLYDTSAAAQSCVNIVIVHVLSLFVPFTVMYALSRKFYVAPLVPNKKVGFKDSLGWIGFGMGCCVVADFVVSFLSTLAKSVGYELTQNSLLEPDSVFACVALVFSTVIAPAVIEEYAFRCCSVGILQKYGKGFAVVVVSILFGMIHGNIIQFIFATLVGLILGYITIKTGNVYIAMIVHGLNNSLSVVSDIIGYAANDTLADKISTGMLLAFIPLGIIGFVYLCKKGIILKRKTAEYNVLADGTVQAFYTQPEEPKENNESKDDVKLSLGTKILCVLPGFAICAPYFIFSIVTTIVKS